jgi:hypothetical protein
MNTIERHITDFKSISGAIRGRYVTQQLAQFVAKQLTRIMPNPLVVQALQDFRIGGAV